MSNYTNSFIIADVYQIKIHDRIYYSFETEKYTIMSNAAVRNYFTIFLQTIDVANFLLDFI